jgi:hypothetical protein
VEGKNLKCGIDRASGLLARIEARTGEASRVWLSTPIRFVVRNEATDNATSLTGVEVKADSGGVSVKGELEALSLKVSEMWTPTPWGISWELKFESDGKRVGHEVVLELPVLSPASQVFTPSDRGVVDVGARPTYHPAPYGHFGWSTGQAYVLPLVSVFDTETDNALTIALPPNVNIPHFQVSWLEGKTLRLSLAHRGMGGGKPSPLKLLMYAHPADYRSVLRAYSDSFPEYFRPTLPRGPYEGTFYYHHIQDHPAFEEMARQNVRYLWSSFWFTHVGEYLPEEKEWIPYTYDNWWRLRQAMSDEKIRAFIQEMSERGIGVYAFFNVDEYGGAGSYGGVEEHGDSPVIERIRKEKFGEALVKDAQGQDIPSWEGCKVLNPDRRYAFYPHLIEQVRRHLARLPEICGFLIDRMDWASILDYGHDDGMTEVGDRPAENMAMPMAEVVQEICRLTHQEGKRVFVNQFYRVEMLRDVDGYCHENDYLPALAYLSPLRPVSAWHYRKPYHGDLLQFEAQLKRRLQFALFPQMIAHEFPISQQEPDTRAADLLEIYAPLFSALIGKEQVLLPHCIAVSGANDVNLFVNGAGHYVAPVTSRVRFLSRRVPATEAVTVSLHVPDGAELQWAHVYSADGPPYRATIIREAGEVKVKVERHGTASVVVVGKGSEPTPLGREVQFQVPPSAGSDHRTPETGDADAARLTQTRDHLFPQEVQASSPMAERPDWLDIKQTFLRVEGAQLGSWGSVAVILDGEKIGEVSSARGTFALQTQQGRLPPDPPKVKLVAPDEGMWFAPQRVELLARRSDGKSYRVALWTPNNVAASGPSSRVLTLQLAWCKTESALRRPEGLGGPAALEASAQAAAH